MSLLSNIESDFQKLEVKIEAWFNKETVIIEKDASKISVFITAKLDPEIEKLITDGGAILIERVIDVVTHSNVGDIVGAAIISAWPAIVQVAQEVQKFVGGIQIVKTMIQAQIRAVINSELANPQPLNWGMFIKDGELILQDLIADIRS